MSSVGLNEHFLGSNFPTASTFDELKRQINSNNFSTFVTPSFTTVTPVHLHIENNTYDISDKMSY